MSQGQLWGLNKIILVMHLPQFFIYIKCFKKVSIALDRWLSVGWSIVLLTKSLPGLDPWLGAYKRQPSDVFHIDVSLSLSPFLLYKINKYILRLGLMKKNSMKKN